LFHLLAAPLQRKESQISAFRYFAVLALTSPSIAGRKCIIYAAQDLAGLIKDCVRLY
jgi:hypothetical protein